MGEYLDKFATACKPLPVLTGSRAEVSDVLLHLSGKATSAT